MHGDGKSELHIFCDLNVTVWCIKPVGLLFPTSGSLPMFFSIPKQRRHGFDELTTVFPILSFRLSFGMFTIESFSLNKFLSNRHNLSLSRCILNALLNSPPIYRKLYLLLF